MRALAWLKAHRPRWPKVAFSDALVFAGVLAAAYGVNVLVGEGWALVTIGACWVALGMLVKH